MNRNRKSAPILVLVAPAGVDDMDWTPFEIIVTFGLGGGSIITDGDRFAVIGTPFVVMRVGNLPGNIEDVGRWLARYEAPVVLFADYTPADLDAVRRLRRVAPVSALLTPGSATACKTEAERLRFHQELRAEVPAFLEWCASRGPVQRPDAFIDPRLAQVLETEP